MAQSRSWKVWEALRRKAVIKGLLQECFGMWETFGIHITPNYFESPIPDSRFLKEEIWSKNSNLTGINMRENEQIKLLETFVHAYKAEYERFPLSKTDCPQQYYVDNSFLGAVDGEILYCMIHHFRPKRVYEVGAGIPRCSLHRAFWRIRKTACL